ncbi:hypothetical protein BZA70DRAFT_280045 [Myxozyma melibiosi]|uniref:Sm domain-containing protein n=1 Tax=Myxozyma melibiosi TaxID=54550 RepID=A0ABR1F4N4_9ASCO
MADESSSLPPVAAYENVKEFMSVLMMVSTTDGRQFCGTLMATDRDRNLILSEASEQLPVGFQSRRGDRFRYVGMIAIPGKHILRIDASKDSLKAREMLLKGVSRGAII